MFCVEERSGDGVEYGVSGLERCYNGQDIMDTATFLRITAVLVYVSSRIRHTRCSGVSWARRCVLEAEVHGCTQMVLALLLHRVIKIRGQ